jgi:hypothetical protein
MIAVLSYDGEAGAGFRPGASARHVSAGGSVRHHLFALAIAASAVLGACALPGLSKVKAAATPTPGASSPPGNVVEATRPGPTASPPREPMAPQSGVWSFSGPKVTPVRLRLTFLPTGAVEVLEADGQPSSMVTNTHGGNRVKLSRCQPDWVRCDDIGYDMVLMSPTRMEGVSYARTDVQTMNREDAVEAVLVEPAP